MNRILKKAAMTAIALGPLSMSAQVAHEFAFVEFVVERISNGKQVECPLCRKPLVITNFLREKSAVPPSTANDVRQADVPSDTHITVENWSVDDNESVTIMIRDEDGTVVEMPKVVDTSKSMTIKLNKGWLLSVFVSKKEGNN